MRYLHTMIRASDLDKTLEFFVSHLGLVEVRRYDSEQGRFTLVFLAASGDAGRAEATLPLRWAHRAVLRDLDEQLLEENEMSLLFSKFFLRVCLFYFQI